MTLEHRNYFTDLSHIFHFRYTHSRLFASNLNAHKALNSYAFRINAQGSKLTHKLKDEFVPETYPNIQANTADQLKSGGQFDVLHVNTLNCKK